METINKLPHIFIENIGILIGLGAVEFLFLHYFASNYMFGDPNNTKLFLVQLMKKSKDLKLNYPPAIGLNHF